MSGLVLKLGPNERVLVNGAVVQNGDRRAKLVIHGKDAKVLRLKEALPACEATTPVRRLVFALQVLIANGPVAGATGEILTRIEELSQVFTDADSRRQLGRATEAHLNGNHYACLRAVKALMPREDRLLAYRGA